MFVADTYLDESEADDSVSRTYAKRCSRIAHFQIQMCVVCVGLWLGIYGIGCLVIPRVPPMESEAVNLANFLGAAAHGICVLLQGLSMAYDKQDRTLVTESLTKKRFGGSGDFDGYALKLSTKATVMTLSSVAMATHLIMAHGTPVFESVFGQRYFIIRWAQWIASVPLQMVLLHSYHTLGLDYPTTADYTFDSRTWSSVGFQTLSTFLGLVASISPIPQWFVVLTLCLSFACFCNIFVILTAVTNRRRGLLLNDIPRSDLFGGNPPHVVVEGEQQSSRTIPAFGTMVAVFESRERLIRSVDLTRICMTVWMAFIVTYFCGLFGLIGNATEHVAYVVVDIGAKVLYSAGLGESQIRAVAQEVAIRRILLVERNAAEQRRHFLRYVMHEVRVPLNAIRLGVENIAEIIQGSTTPRITSGKQQSPPETSSYVEEEEDDDPGTKAETTCFMFLRKRHRRRRSEDDDVREERKDAVADASISNFEPHTTNESSNEEDRSGSLEGIVETVEESITTMSTTLDDVVTYASVEEGSFQMRKAPFKVEECFWRFHEMFAAAGAQRQVTVEHRFDARLHDVWLDGDSSRLAECAKHFHENALKFSARQQSPTVKVVVRLDDDQDDVHPVVGDDREAFLLRRPPSSLRVGSEIHLRLDVSDNGIGMAAETQTTVFTPFTHVRPGEIHQGRGSGLGLATVRHILSLYGGRVGVDSTLGKGSTFYFTIPLTVVDPPLPVVGPPPSRSRSEDTTASPTTQEQRKPRALVVDDVASNRKLLGMQLQKIGFDVVLAADGREALITCGFTGDDVDNDVVPASLRSPPFDVVCMDYVMPTMDGLATVAYLRRAGFTGYIVGVTGNAMADDVDAFKQAGADDVLNKPVDRKRLVSRLTTAGVLPRRD